MSLNLRIALTLIALLLLPAYSAMAGDAMTTLSITISPTSGPQSTQIAVTGQGAEVGLPVWVMIAADGETGSEAMTAAQVDPDGNGNFGAAIVVPADVVDGRYAVRAEQRTPTGVVMQYSWAGLSVGPPESSTLGGLREISLVVAAILAALLVGMMAFQGMRLALCRQQTGTCHTGVGTRGRH